MRVMQRLPMSGGGNMAEMRKKLIMNIDFFDEIGLHGGSMGPEDVAGLVLRCADSGIDAIFWRAAGLGVAGYPSALLSDEKWLASADLSDVISRTPSRREAPQSDRYGQDGPVAATLKRMDPVAEAKKACAEAGIGFYIWLDLFDEQNGRFVTEHPECRVRGRNSAVTWPGLRSYANAAAVSEKLDILEELKRYGPDGFYFSLSCHSRHLEFPEEDDYFGFEPEVCERFREETGKDLHSISTPEEYDVWHRIKGDFFTEFLRSASSRLHQDGMSLAVGTQYGRYTEFACPYMSSSVKYRFETQWKRWIDEGIADALVLGDYEWPWDMVPVWDSKGVKKRGEKYPADLLTPEYVEYSDGRADIILFSSWLSAYAQHHAGASASDLDGAMRMRARTLVDTGADGILLHEAHTFEFYNGFDTVRRMRGAVDSSGACCEAK